MTDVLNTRDRPTLRAIIEQCEDRGWASLGQISRTTGLDEKTVARSLVALRSQGLIEGTVQADGTMVVVLKVSPGAYQLAGAWPSDAEALADRIVEALQHLADNGTPDERGRARKILDAVTGDSRALFIGAGGQALGTLALTMLS